MFSLYLCDSLMNDIIYHTKLSKNGFKKLFINAQISFIQNSLKFLTKTVFEYIHNHQMLDNAIKYKKIGYIDISIKNKFASASNYKSFYTLFTTIITNKAVVDKLIDCYKTYRSYLSRTQQKWKNDGWEDEWLEIDDDSLSLII